MREEGVLYLPVHFALVLEQSERDTVDRRIAPALVEESTSAVQVVKVVLVCLASPEVQVGDLEIGPEVTRRVAVCLRVMDWPPLGISDEFHGVVLVQVLRVLSEELFCLGPQAGNRFRGVIK